MKGWIMSPLTAWQGCWESEIKKHLENSKSCKKYNGSVIIITLIIIKTQKNRASWHLVVVCFSPYGCPPLCDGPITIHWKNCLSPTALWPHLCHKACVPVCGGTRSGLSIQFSWPMWLSLCYIWSALSHGLNYYSFIIVLVSVKHVPSFPCKIIFGLLHLHIHFRIGLSNPSLHSNNNKRPIRSGLGWRWVYRSIWGHLPSF